jgi:nitroreductase
MELNQVIAERRSTRKYTEQRVTEEQLREIIETTIDSPTWKNFQSWRFYCISSKEKCDAFRKACLPGKNYENAENAALIVTTFVKGLSGFSRDGKQDNEMGDGWGYLDNGIAIEAICLKAKDMGLDTLIMGIRSEPEIRKFLNIPEDQVICAVLTVGYGDDPHDKPRRKSVDEVASFL